MDIAKDIFNEIAERAGWPQIENIESPTLSTRHRKMLRVLNRALKTLGTFNDWPTLRKSASLLLVASELSDTTAGSEQYVTATNGSDLITVDNKTFDDTYIGRAILINGTADVYSILAAPAPGQLQLDRIWIGEDLVPADQATFVIAMDQYALPDDFGRFSDKAKGSFAPLSIQPLDPPEFAAKRRMDPGIVLDQPVFFTVYGLNKGETNQLVHFHPFPIDQQLVRYDYQMVHPTITSNNDKILYPPGAITILIDAVLEIVEGDLEADDSKVARVIERQMKNYNLHQTHLGPTANRVEIRPANDIRVRTRQWGPSVKIDWGEFWDRAEDRLP